MDVLDRPYKLSPEQIAYYQKNRFIKLKQVFDAETIAHFNVVIAAKVDELNTQKKEKNFVKLKVKEIGKQCLSFKSFLKILWVLESTIDVNLLVDQEVI